MIINKEEHKRRMLQILADISANPLLAINLGFKGGTCCYFVHGLDRFSVDLDFDLLNKDKQEIVLNELDKVLAKYGEVKMEGSVFARKVKYDNQSATVKIDVSEHMDINKLNTYKIVDVVSGVPLKILSKEDIFAHKLIALIERSDNKIKNKIIANRDLYDIDYFFSIGWKYNKEIIALRSDKSCKKYFEELKVFIETKVDEKNILEGLGSLVDDKKRNWVKKNLKSEVLKKIAIEIGALED
jgi:predicted nucleotidyltransferase component of viral defense system